jgi:hypothetical protein
LAANLVTLTATITDADHDTASATLDLGQQVNFHDDGPTAYTPDAQTTTDIAGNVITGALNTHVGADGLGDDTITSFTSGATTLTANGDSTLTFNSQHILLSGFGTETLTGFVDGAGGTANHYDQGIDTLVFTMTLDPSTDTYNFELDHPIDNGSGVSFPTAGGISGGNTHFFSIDVPNSVDDLLVTGGDTSTDTVNTNHNNYGIGGAQSVSFGDTIRFEFVDYTTPLPSSGTVTTADLNNSYGGMSNENGFAFTVEGVQSNHTSQMTISLFDENNPQILVDNNLQPAGSSPVDVNEIAIISGGTTYTFMEGNLPPVPSGGFTVDFTGDTAHVTGLSNGDFVEIFGATAFNDLTIEDTGSDKNVDSDFKINSPSLLQTTNGSPLDVSFGTTQTDADGDSATGTIGLTLDPSASSSTLVGGSGNDTLIGGAAADTLTGGGGNDTFKYTSISDSTHAAPDTITDFTDGSDVIDFSAIAGITTDGGNVGNAAPATVAANTFVYYQSGADTVVLANASGSSEPAGGADMMMVLTGVTASTLHPPDFVHHA